MCVGYARKGKKLLGAMEQCRGMRLKVHGDMATTRSRTKRGSTKQEMKRQRVEEEGKGREKEKMKRNIKEGSRRFVSFIILAVNIKQHQR